MDSAPPSAPVELLDHPASSWRELAQAHGLEPYRGDQLAHWVFRCGVFAFDAMDNLPVRHRERAPELFAIRPPSVHQRFTSVDHSRRYLLDVGGGDLVEAVSMPYSDRTTLCLSSQVGCRFACTFCQTGVMGLGRSLSVGEIVGQVVRLRDELGESGQRLNVVFMGQGEPLDNVDNVLGAVVALQDPKGPALGRDRITVSTVGLVPAIRRLAELGRQRPRVAISLNATSDAARSELMPVNRRYPIADLIGVLREIPWRRRERVTFEYVLLRDVNDTLEDARRLRMLLGGLPAKVNLIPWNAVPDLPYARPSTEAVEAFRREALRGGLDVLVRYSRGADIGAACGQLQTAAVRGS